MNSHSGLNYALCDGKPIHISRISGHAGNGYTCPACGQPLAVRSAGNAAIRFEHVSGAECRYGREVSLQLAMSELISRIGGIAIPAVYIEFRSHKQPILLSEPRTVSVEKAETLFLTDDNIPDILLTSGGKRLLLIMRTAAGCSEESLNRLTESGMSAIGINLSRGSDLLSGEALTPFVTDVCREKYWIRNAVAEKYLNGFKQVSERLPVHLRGTMLTVSRCPRAEREGRAARYADFIDDCCMGCEYFIDLDSVYHMSSDRGSYTSKEYILCSGRSRVSTLKDLEAYFNRFPQDV